jgi:hypothetical protein
MPSIMKTIWFFSFGWNLFGSISDTESVSAIVVS